MTHATTRSWFSILLLLVSVAANAQTAATATPKKGKPGSVERGQYLVNIMGCHDCHTPFKMGPKGPEPDMTRMLSGHPQDLVMPAPPALDPAGPWGYVGAATNTAYAGPWGISFTANLTPDPETGLAHWTSQTFIDALRSGLHEGRGRPILPPMPWPVYRNATDDDLKAIFSYLQTLPPIKNKVPQPIEAPES